MTEIIPINTLEQKNDLLEVIRDSFATVALEFNITKENAPTNPAFLSLEALNDSIRKGLEFFALYSDDRMAGCIGIQASKGDHVFYIERVAVFPEYRHKHFGTQLLNFAIQKIKDKGGKEVSIGIINENIVLKNWYQRYGFVESGVKRFDHLPFTVCFMKYVISKE